MTLSKDQIEYLFHFCERHYVYHYDVQVELVDHLANAVEIQMAEGVSFEKALEKVYSTFGVMGFAPIVREKTKQVEREANRLYYREILKQQIQEVLNITQIADF